MKRFLLQTLWLVLPFLVLSGLSWRAWWVEAEMRRTRAVEAGEAAAERALEVADERLGLWRETPRDGGVVAPPSPAGESAEALAARARYAAGDFEGVLGSPAALRSEAGLSLRSLAAFQMIRRETDPQRLGELVAVLVERLDFASPPFLEEVERRYAELKLDPPPALAGWRERWRRRLVEAELAREAGEGWITNEGASFLVEHRGNGREWRVSGGDEVGAAAAAAVADESAGLAEGLGLELVVAGKVVAGAGRPALATVVGPGKWSARVMVADAEVFRRPEDRLRKGMLAVLGLATAALVIGLVQSGRAYLRAVELARRQGEFMAAVSHEMRTPLAAMRLLAENLESGVADRSGLRDKHVRLIRSECVRLGELVGNVLAFTRREEAPAEFEAFDIKALMYDVDALVRPLAAQKEVALETRVEAFPQAPHGDAAALRRALLNLADNALKHAPAGTSVRCHAAPAANGTWSLVVIDHGPGVPARERRKIFDPFYRVGDELRRTTPGTGLGLALVKRTALAHHGRIAVDDAPGGGARFTLTLPLRPDLE